MMSSQFNLCCLIWCIYLYSCFSKAVHDEPGCSSRFDFEDRLLERSVSLSHDMKILKETVNKMLEELHTEKEKMATKLSTLSDQLTAGQRSKNEQLTTLAEAVNTGFQDKLVDVDTFMAKTAKDMDNMMQLHENQVARISSDFHTLTNETLDKMKDKVVAFCVTVPTTKQSVNGVATFNKIITNIGEGYNKDTGQFTCPVAGVYMFSFTVLSNSGSSHVYCHIRLNGASKMLGDAYKSLYSSHTVTVTWLLQLNDVVDLGNCGGGWSHVETAYGRTVFNGVLISKA